MTRRKGEVTDKQRNRSHPYQVELVTPLGRGYDIISRWAAWHDHVTTNGSGSMCWCFCRPEVADAFAMDFGGRRIDRPVRPYYLEVDLPDAKELERRAKGARVGLDIVMGGREFDYSRPFRGVEKIPFSSFSSPADVARAQGALDKAWEVVKGDVPEADHERERVRLAYVVASFALIALDDEDLAGRAVTRFRQGPQKG